MKNIENLDRGSTAYCQALAKIFEQLVPEKQHGGYIPRCIDMVIRLLYEDNFESAKNTFHWEADKMAYHKEIIEIGKKYF